MSDDIRIFKLITGEEMLAKVESIVDDAYTLSKPLTLVPTQTGLSLTPGLFTAVQDKPIVLYKHSIVMQSEHPRQELLASYIEGTTGIKPVQKPKLILG